MQNKYIRIIVAKIFRYFFLDEYTHTQQQYKHTHTLHKTPIHTMMCRTMIAKPTETTPQSQNTMYIDSWYSIRWSRRTCISHTETDKTTPTPAPHRCEYLDGAAIAAAMSELNCFYGSYAQYTYLQTRTDREHDDRKTNKHYTHNNYIRAIYTLNIYKVVVCYIFRSLDRISEKDKFKQIKMKSQKELEFTIYFEF